jgi:hypothetical protein
MCCSCVTLLLKWILDIETVLTRCVASPSLEYHMHWPAGSLEAKSRGLKYTPMKEESRGSEVAVDV